MTVILRLGGKCFSWQNFADPNNKRLFCLLQQFYFGNVACLVLTLLWCVVWCGVVWCGVVWCGVVWCGVVWCGVVWCGVVWCGVVWYGVVWYGV